MQGITHNLYPIPSNQIALFEGYNGSYFLLLVSSVLLIGQSMVLS